MNVRADAETLRRIPIFADCDPGPLQVMAFAAERQSFEPGEAIIVEGQTGISAYLMLSGRADINVLKKSRTPAIGHAEPGTLLGELAMIGMTPYALTVIASAHVATARIDRKLFLRVAEAYPDFSSAVFHALARRLDRSLRDFSAVRGLFENARSFARSS